MRASVIVYADWIIVYAFSPITNTIANGKRRVIGWLNTASRNRKDLVNVIQCLNEVIVLSLTCDGRNSVRYS